LEQIIEKLSQENDDERKTLLNCRLVNPHWTSVTNKVLEQRHVSMFKTWNPLQTKRQELEEFYREQALRFFIPKVGLAVDEEDNNIFVTEACELVFLNREEGGLRLRQKSLYLCPAEEVEKVPKRTTRTSTTYQKGKEKEAQDKQGIFQLVATYGKHLTSLIIHGIRLTPQQLRQILASLPSLKSLIIVECIVSQKNGEDLDKSYPLPSLPSLSTLVVRLNAMNYSPRYVKYHIPAWLTSAYGPQLTHLEVDHGRLLDINKFDKLEQLKIFGLLNIPPELDNLENVAPLERLSLLELVNRGRGKVSRNELLKFTGRFSGTLVDLHLDIHDIYLKGVGWERSRHTGPSVLEDDVSFPLLKTVGYPFPKYYEYLQSGLKYYLERAPSLETLLMIDCRGGFDSNHVKYCWELCGGLKKISMYQDRYESSLQVTVYKGCDLEYWKSNGRRFGPRTGWKRRCRCSVHADMDFGDVSDSDDGDNDDEDDSDNDAENSSGEESDVVEVD